MPTIDTRGIPDAEFAHPYVRCITSGTRQEFYITQSKPLTEKKPFTLWKPTPHGYTRDGTAETPQALYERIPKEA